MLWNSRYLTLLQNLEKLPSPLITSSWNKSEVFYICDQSNVECRLSERPHGVPIFWALPRALEEERAGEELGLSKATEGASGEAAPGEEAPE